MLKKNCARLLVIAALSLPVHAAETPPLSKTDAAKILMSMGYGKVQVAAVVHGVAELRAGPNVATVIGIGRFREDLQKIEIVFYYDEDIGWFSHQFEGPPLSKTVTKLQVWTLDGPMELKANP